MRWCFQLELYLRLTFQLYLKWLMGLFNVFSASLQWVAGSQCHIIIVIFSKKCFLFGIVTFIWLLQGCKYVFVLKKFLGFVYTIHTVCTVRTVYSFQDWRNNFDFYSCPKPKFPNFSCHMIFKYLIHRNILTYYELFKKKHI